MHHLSHSPGGLSGGSFRTLEPKSKDDNEALRAGQRKNTQAECGRQRSWVVREAGLAIRILAVVDKDFEQAMRLVKELPLKGVRLNILHISPLVEGLVDSGLLSDAVEVTHRAAQHFGTEPTLRLHTAIIRGYIARDDKKKEFVVAFRGE